MMMLKWSEKLSPQPEDSCNVDLGLTVRQARIPYEIDSASYVFSQQRILPRFGRFANSLRFLWYARSGHVTVQPMGCFLMSRKV
jgi:hypothetical protein